MGSSVNSCANTVTFVPGHFSAIQEDHADQPPAGVPWARPSASCPCMHSLTLRTTEAGHIIYGSIAFCGLSTCFISKFGFRGAVPFKNCSPSILALLSTVAGSLKPEDDCVPSLTLTPPDPTLTVRASADCRSADAPPTGCSGSGRLAWTRSICSCLDSCSDMSC